MIANGLARISSIFRAKYARRSPVVIKSPPYFLRVYARYFGGFGNRHNAILICNEPAVAFVPGLVFFRSPFAIIGFVVLANIDSLYSEILRAYAHVSKKIFKVIYPTLANGDASRPIIYETCVFRIIASLFHTRPALPRSCQTSGVSDGRVTVLKTEPAYLHTTSQASTRSRISSSKIVHGGHRRASAFTSAIPVGMRSISPNKRGHCKATELFTCQIGGRHAR